MVTEDENLLPNSATAVYPWQILSDWDKEVQTTGWSIIKDCIIDYKVTGNNEKHSSGAAE